VRLSAWFFLGAWFLYQLVEANAGLVSTAQGNNGGVAFCAHVGGFVFGFAAAWLLSVTLSRNRSLGDQGCHVRRRGVRLPTRPRQRLAESAGGC
jgi:membrane associated rhomboid family serine protease